jgi:hypothetical protein
MNLYLDDDSVERLLVQLLIQTGHDVQIPADVGLSGSDDAIHLKHAIDSGRVCLTRNHRDFVNLHNLIMSARGHHPGVLVVRRDNDPHRDMTARGIVNAVRNLATAGVPLADCFYVLNHWR